MFSLEKITALSNISILDWSRIFNLKLWRTMKRFCLNTSLARPGHSLTACNIPLTESRTNRNGAHTAPPLQLQRSTDCNGAETAMSKRPTKTPQIKNWTSLPYSKRVLQLIVTKRIFDFSNFPFAFPPPSLGGSGYEF